MRDIFDYLGIHPSKQEKITDDAGVARTARHRVYEKAVDLIDEPAQPFLRPVSKCRGVGKYTR